MTLSVSSQKNAEVIEKEGDGLRSGGAREHKRVRKARG